MLLTRIQALPRRILTAAKQKARTHEVDPRTFVALYVLSAIPFYTGIYFILRGSGVFDIGFRDLLSFDLHRVHLSGSTVALGFLLNRLGWALPYLYVEVRGRNLGWYVHAAVWLWISLSIWTIW